MPASRRVARAVSAVLDTAPRQGEVSMVRLVQAVADSRGRRIEIQMEELPAGVCGQWRQYRDHDVFLIQEGLPAWDRTLAHELGHLVLGHDGISVVDAAREETELVSDDLIRYMLNQRTGCMGPSGEDAEQEAEDFAALLGYRLGGLAGPSLNRSGPPWRGIRVIVWVIAGLLGVATGLRVGWALVNKQSVVSAAMMLALGSMGFVAALNWQPLTLLVDTLLRWPNISLAISQVALTICAAASCVMITSAASAMRPVVTRRLALANYGIAVVIATVSVVLFFADGRQPEMAPQEYLRRNLTQHTSLPWLLPLLYILLVLTVVLWAGLRYSNTTRRGRALFVFSVGIGLLVLTSGFFLLRAVGSTEFVSVGSAITLLASAMLIVEPGSLLPSIEDWFGARREMRIIEPLLRELCLRQPDVGVGVRPRGPLGFQVAEQMSLISDGLFLEATQAHEAAREGGSSTADWKTPAVSADEQARAVAKWIHDGAGDGDHTAHFPGLAWLQQPDGYSDREWILKISRQYYELTGGRRSTPVANTSKSAGGRTDARSG